MATPSSPPSRSPGSASLCPPVVEIDFDANQVVPGRANIFGAGRDLPPEPGGGGAGQLPPLWLLPTGSGRVVTITCASGRVIPRDSDGIANGSAGDGYGPTDIESHEGVSGIIDAHNGMFLVGVFLTDSSPSDPAPERLDFTDNETFDVLAPKIAQTFLVGDGIGRRYRVPSDATRLFLGFADAAAYRGEPGYYGNNGGVARGERRGDQRVRVAEVDVPRRADQSMMSRYPVPRTASTTGLAPPSFRRSRRTTTSTTLLPTSDS